MYEHIDPSLPAPVEPWDHPSPVTCLISDIKRAVEERQNKKGGPKTPEGKRISSLNALRSGIHAQIACLPAEDLAEFNRIVGAIRAELEPKGIRETLLATGIGECHFRIARIRAVENSLFANGYRNRIQDIDSGHPEVDAALCNAETWAEQHKQFMNLQLYETRLANLIRRQTEELEQLQSLRKAACRSAEDEALLLLRHAKSKGEEYQPGADFEPPSAHGEFVFSAEALMRRWDRETRLAAARNWDPDCNIARPTPESTPKTHPGGPKSHQAA